MRHPAAPTLCSSFLVLRLLLQLESTHQGTVRAGLTPLKQGAYRMMQWYSQRISNQLRVSCAFPTILTHVIAFLHIRLTLSQTMIWCSRMRCSSDNKPPKNMRHTPYSPWGIQCEGGTRVIVHVRRWPKATLHPISYSLYRLRTEYG